MNPIRLYKEWIDRVVESILPAIVDEEIKAVRANRQNKDSRIVANGSSDTECRHPNPRWEGQGDASWQVCDNCGESLMPNDHLEVKPPDIRASGTSDTPPEYGCNHRTAGLLPEPDGTLEILEFDFCPKCGVKL